MLDGRNNDDIVESPLPLAPVVGRRRTRATAQIDLMVRREQFKRQRARAAALEQVAHTSNRNAAADNTENISANVRAPLRSSRRQRSTAATAVTHATNAYNNATTAGMTSPTAKVVVGASFGEKLSTTSVVIERTPTRKELQSPPQIRRMKPAPQANVPTPEKIVPAAAGVEKVESSIEPTSAATDALTDAQPSTTAAAAMSDVRTDLTVSVISDTAAPALKPKRVAARTIAQSSASLSTRKRMISFSPERDERPENRALALQKAAKNLKATAKLQQRLDDLQTPVKRPATTPIRFETPSAPTNVTLELLSDDDDDGDVRNDVVSNDHKAVDGDDDSVMPTSQDNEGDVLRFDSQCTDAGANDNAFDDFDASVCATQVLLSQASEADSAVAPSQPPMSCSQEPMDDHHDATASSSSSSAFTSTSVIEDVGLFNCDNDVEYTGGVYGEGTDGKVAAAVIHGQKVALKRAKPHDGFPEDEAKRRSAVELHYLRRVRHLDGFVQCLGLCDAIAHTCIALEVMDCKLSDYLRRYGTSTSSTSSASTGSTKRRYTLGLADAKGLLQQIARPMMLLHDQVNVAHGDLACRNILLRTPPKGYERKWAPVVKLSDFGRIKLPSTEPKILDSTFSFYKNVDVGAFGREILFRFLVGEIVPPSCLETRSLHKQLQDLVVTQVPDAAKERLGPYYRLFMRCTGWGVRPTFREIVEHLDDLEYFETTENGLFPLKPSGSTSGSTTSTTSTTTATNNNNNNSVGATGDASFLSPVHDTASRTAKFRGGKYETPTGLLQRSTTANGATSRLLQSKSNTDGSVPGAAAPGNKTVNLLKPRSVLRGTPHKVPNTNSTGSTGTTGATGEKLLHPRSLAASSGFTPNGRPMLLKKTPPSAGASRRSLQILSQIQHRTAGSGGDKNGAK